LTFIRLSLEREKGECLPMRAREREAWTERRDEEERARFFPDPWRMRVSERVSEGGWVEIRTTLHTTLHLSPLLVHIQSPGFPEL